MIPKLTILVFLIYTITSLKLISHNTISHHQDDDKQQLTIKFRNNDIQDKNHCQNDDQDCQVQICPETYVMKSSYSCYSIIRDQLNAWMVKYNKKIGKGKDNKNYKINLECWKMEDSNDDSGEGAKPQGGFNNKLYLCDIDGQKPLHYHYVLDEQQ